MRKFTHVEKCDEAMREAGKRRGVYPKLIAKGSLDQTKADRLIAIMDEIAADYEAAYKRAAGSGSDRLSVAMRGLRKIVETSGNVGVAYEIARATLKELAP
jgi:hypothetical protein